MRAVLLGLILASASWAAPGDFVQGAANTGSSPGPISVSITTTANNLVVVVCFTPGSNSSLSAANSGSDTFETTGWQNNTASGRAMQLFYVVPTASRTSYSCTAGNNNGATRIGVAEYELPSGHSWTTANILDQYATGDNNNVSAWVTSATATTTNASNLFFAAAHNNTEFTTTSGWTLRPTAQYVNSLLVQDRMVSTIDSYTAQATATANSFGPMVGVLFKISAPSVGIRPRRRQLIL